MMKRIFTASLLALAALAVAGWVVTMAGERAWVSQDGHAHRLHEDAQAFFIDEDDADVFDVADLADGETRVLGQGAKQVTATRSGDEVSLTRTATDDERELSITCRLSSDTCQILTFDEDPEKVMIVIKKTRECTNGIGDCGPDLADIHIGESSHRVIVRKTIECDDEGNCAEDEHVSGLHGAHAIVEIDEIGSADAHGVHVIRGGPATTLILEEGDDVILRCPEGDTKMHVSKDEAEDVFLCPKHSVPLERIDVGGAKKILIRKQAAGEDD